MEKYPLAYLLLDVLSDDNVISWIAAEKLQWQDHYRMCHHFIPSIYK